LKLCEGNLRCQEAAPEIFEVGDDDRSRVIVAEPTGKLKDKARTAAKMCPRQAITLLGD
jgi:ferredoxin